MISYPYPFLILRDIRMNERSPTGVISKFNSDLPQQSLTQNYRMVAFLLLIGVAPWNFQSPGNSSNYLMGYVPVN
jgi:hypothetical protein